jgi:hypothetical protein
VRLAIIGVLLLLAVGACLMISCSGGTGTRTRIQTGPVVATQVTCPTDGLQGATCFSLDISCPNIPNYTAYAKIITPTNPVGTVIFTTGGDGNALYETDGLGTTTVTGVVDASYEAVQLTFGAPFSSDPGWQHDVNGQGVRAAACRYAMIVQWLAQQAPSVPLCATGNSAGGQIIGEGLAHYSLGNNLTFAELTSGPPFSSVDQACDPSVPTLVEPCSNATVGMSVGVSDAQNFIDPAYPGPWCSQQIQTGIIQHQPQFLNDSITLGSDAVLNYPNTKINFLFGGMDTSSAIRQGAYYRSQITSTTSVGCVQDAPHDIPQVQDGAQTIAVDLIANCHK